MNTIKKIFSTIVWAIRMVLGALCILMGLAAIILTFQEKQPLYLIMFLFFALFAYLLLKKPKNRKKKAVSSPADCVLTTTDIKCITPPPESLVNVNVEIIPDYPVYPNQDTDIPAVGYIHDKSGGIRRIDGKPINDADAAYIVRNSYAWSVERDKASSNPKFHRTPAERELMYRFTEKYGGQSQKLCGAFQDYANQAYLTNNYDEKLVLTQQCLEAYEYARNWHYNKSKGAMLWFQDLWEHCHNSRSECFRWIDSTREYMDYLIMVRDIYTPWIRENAKDGFLQTEIYKAFPNEDKSALRKVIDSLAERGEVQKTKKGSTYFIQTSVPEQLTAATPAVDNE